MFDNPICQHAPSVIERFGVCTHGLIHYVTSSPSVGGVTAADKKDIKIVTNGGKTFYPFLGSIEKYNIYETARSSKSYLFQHPDAIIEAEDIDGIDWSGYAIMHTNTVDVQFYGIKDIPLDMFPFVPDANGLEDPRLAIYSSSYSCARYVLEWAGGTSKRDGIVTNTGFPPTVATVYSEDGRYRARPITLPWEDSVNENNFIRMAYVSGVWPNVTVNTYDVDGVNYHNIDRVSDDKVKTIKVESRQPLTGLCTNPIPSLTFEVSESFTIDPNLPDNFTQEEINTTLITCTVDTVGVLDHLKLTVRDYKDRTTDKTVTGSISVDEGDSSECVPPGGDPSEWVIYDGAKQSYTSAENITGAEIFEVKLHGFGGESKYSRETSSYYNSSIYTSVGTGTMEENVSESTVDGGGSLTLLFDDVEIIYAITDARIGTAYGSLFKTGLPFNIATISDTYEWLFIYENGSSVYDGGVIALLRVFMYRYSGDMYALAYGLAKGYATQIAPDEYHFNVISQELKIGSVFSHGRHHAGSYTGDDVGALLFGASNPKTGEIVRDMPYPAIYI